MQEVLSSLAGSLTDLPPGGRRRLRLAGVDGVAVQDPALQATTKGLG